MSGRSRVKQDSEILILHSKNQYAAAAAAAAKSLQSCPTPCDPMDCSPPGFSIHGIFQARVLEWSAIAFLEISFTENWFFFFF